VDPSGDSLRPNASAPPVSVAKVTPVDPPGLPDLIATTQDDVQLTGACADAGLRPRWTAEPVIAQVRGDEVSVTAVWPDGRESLPDGGIPRGPECTPAIAPATYQDRFVGSLGGRRAQDLAVVGGTAFVLVESGGLCAFQWSPGTAALAATCRAGVFPFAATRLRSDPGNRGVLLAYSSTSYAVFDIRLGTVRTGRVTPFGGSPQPIGDMIIQGSPGGELLTAVSDGGFYVSSLAGYRFENDGGPTPPFGFWEPVQTVDLQCQRELDYGPYGPPLELRLSYDHGNTGSNDPMLAVHVRENAGTQMLDHALLYRATGDAGSPWYGACAPLPAPTFAPGQARLYVEHFADCIPCGEDHRLRDYRVGWQYPDFGGGDPTLVMEARCLPRDGGTEELVNVITDVLASCRGTVLDDPPRLPDIDRYVRPTRWDHSDGWTNAYANDLGHFYATDFSAGLGLPAMVMDRAPTAVVQTASGLAASTSSEIVGDPFDPTTVTQLLPRELTREGGAGFGGTGNDFFPPYAGVTGQPTWGVVGDEAVGIFFVVENNTRPVTQEQVPLRMVAHLTSSVKWAPPFAGAALRNPLGRVVLMVSSGDALTAVDVTEYADNPDLGSFDEQSFFTTPELDVRVVPLPRAPITSLVPLPPEPDAGRPLFAEAYLAQGGRVFYVTAENHTLWHAEEINLGGAEVTAVIADGRRGRAGTKDGRVFALPSRVPLSGPLSGAPVVDYAQAGATTFAVAAGGLYRLVSDGSTPLGTWEPLAVATLPADGRGYGGARMYTVGDQLLLFLHSGWGYRISGGR